MKRVLGQLVYDTSKEQGDVVIDWDKMPTDMVMLDTINDWRHDLSDLYESKSNEVFNKGESK